MPFLFLEAAAEYEADCAPLKLWLMRQAAGRRRACMSSMSLLLPAPQLDMAS